MSQKSDKRLNEERIEKQSKQPCEQCDYLHPEQCQDNQEKSDLSATRKEVGKEADEFIEKKNS